MGSEDARALREGKRLEKRQRFEDVDDDRLLQSAISFET